MWTRGSGGSHSLTLKGNGVTITGHAGSDVLSTSAGVPAALSIDAVTINGGSNGIYAGGGASITLTNSTRSGSTADGIDNADGDVTVTNSTVTGSTTDGVYGSGAITVTNTMITGSGGYAMGTANGSTMNVVNSTIANNADVGVGAGNLSHENLAYATITGNGDVQVFGGSENTLSAFGSVVASPGNSAPNCSFGSASSTTSQGYNYADDATCGFTQPTDKLSAANPNLGALGANGGPTPTEMPNTGSPLIDSIPVASCQTGLAAGITTDQRGVTRPQGPGCDIGAVEVAVVTTPLPPLI